MLSSIILLNVGKEKATAFWRNWTILWAQQTPKTYKYLTNNCATVMYQAFEGAGLLPKTHAQIITPEQLYIALVDRHCREASQYFQVYNRNEQSLMPHWFRLSHKKAVRGTGFFGIPEKGCLRLMDYQYLLPKLYPRRSILNMHAEAGGFASMMCPNMIPGLGGMPYSGPIPKDNYEWLDEYDRANSRVRA